ncbi:glutathionylspermidine synthase family protein [Pseudoalteromonas fenneropenaei]|uniref:Glutathionylspermidine synthase family protein n=1 Tax=Pseudoalteromonas fenneropenaei TaxID=1737459 RepID=A0ABV7CH65_9GAMM
MLRISCQERPDLAAQAQFYGFDFYRIDNEMYWDERAFYQFTLKQIEHDLEDPSNELAQMCESLVEKIVTDEQLLRRFCIPEPFWDLIADSWHHRDMSLYGRFDFSYNGKASAKLLEYNADTPTSLYEAAFFQWQWLEQQVDRGVLPRNADQFNCIQERLIAAFARLPRSHPWHFAYCADSIEDKGTVMYLQDCAYQAGLATALLPIEDLGVDALGQLTDLEDQPVQGLFKLYPWEQLFSDDFAAHLNTTHTRFIEPPWKAVLSNKAILPLLWQHFPNHPNLLPAYFAGEEQADLGEAFVSKPVFGREGSNVTWFHPQKGRIHQGGSYGSEGFITQALAPLPQFGNDHTLCGVWLVDNQACGLTIREDESPITKDTARFVPHIIV